MSDVFVDSLKDNFLNFCAIPNIYKHNILLILLWTMNIFSLIFLSLDLESAKFFCDNPGKYIHRGHVVTLILLSSAFKVQKQPETIYKWMCVAVS